MYRWLKWLNTTQLMQLKYLFFHIKCVCVGGGEDFLLTGFSVESTKNIFMTTSNSPQPVSLTSYGGLVITVNENSRWAWAAFKKRTILNSAPLASDRVCIALVEFELHLLYKGRQILRVHDVNPSHYDRPPHSLHSWMAWDNWSMNVCAHLPPSFCRNTSRCCHTR